MAIVLHHSRAKGAAKLILLGIANHAGDGGAWPSVSTLARYAGITERGVQLALRKLQQSGELYVDRQAGGLAHMKDWERPNRYEVLVTCPIYCDRSPNHRVRTPAVDSSTQLSLVPDLPTSDRVNQASPPEPSFTHPGEAGFTRTVHNNQPPQVSRNVTTSRGREPHCRICFRPRSVCELASRKAHPDDQHTFQETKP